MEEEQEKLPADVRARKEIYDWIQCLMIALIICVVLFIFFIRIIDVSGKEIRMLREGPVSMEEIKEALK